MSSATTPAPASSLPPAPSSVTTVTPPESASQPGKENKKGSRSHRAPQTRSAASKVPTGSIPVPPPKSRPSFTTSAVVSAAVPITGWGLSDLPEMTKRAPLQEFEPDASGFFGLVDAVYDDSVSHASNALKHLPSSLFRYYCGMAWWYRVLTVHRQNGFPLWTQAKRLLDSFSGLEELVLPDKIAQYLANLGNFDYNGETYRMRVPELDFSQTASLGKGLPPQPGQIPGDLTADSFWRYAQVPVPSSLVATVFNEAARASGSTKVTWPHTPPSTTGSVYATANIVGYSLGLAASHSSWTSTFRNLGWETSRFPKDLQTDFCFAPSTMKWVSDRLGTTSLKMHPFKQIGLTRHGNFGQIAWLSTPEHLQTTHTKLSHLGVIQEFSAATAFEYQLSSRSALPGSVLSALFCFGYQVERHATPDGKATLFAPWLSFDKDGNLEPLPDGFLAPMNRPLDLVDSDLKVPRYHTYAKRRQTVLVAALLPA